MMKIRVCLGDVDLTVTDVVAYSPDVLEDILTRTIEAATRLHLTDVLAIDRLTVEASSEAPPVGSEPSDD